MPHTSEIRDEGFEAQCAIAWVKVAGDLYGLTPEQVAAIPRLIAWFTDPGFDHDGFLALREAFPLPEAILDSQKEA